jgi:1-acyl-sn-glycerol-3-phosphate acyltransferase
MLDKKQLVPENYSSIYDYFEQFEPKDYVQKLGFLAMHKLYKSDLHFTDGSDEIIENHLANDGNIILAPNHQSNSDIPAIAAIAHTKTFDNIRGNTIIPSKVDMFKWPLVGRFIPHMQAHPTFRSKDFDDSPESQALKASITERLMQFNIDYIDGGGNVAMFPEGTRNKGNPRDVQPLKAGLARIALGVSKPKDLLILPLGFAYRKDKPKRSPVIVCPSPVSPVSLNQDELLHLTRSRLQDATTHAFDIALSD